MKRVGGPSQVFLCLEEPADDGKADLILHLRHAGGDEAYENEILSAGVHELVFLASGDEDNGAAGDGLPLAIAVDLALA